MLIAKRILHLNSFDKPSIEVCLYAPQEQDGAFFCRYTIGWPNGIVESAGWGVDAIQAILLTLQKIGVDVYMSDAHANGSLIWREPDKGYGFPVPKNARDVLIGDDAVYDG
jgi:hypothetical protein